MKAFRDRPKFRETKFHKWMNLKCSLYNVIWRFYTHHCPKCGTTLFEFRGVHDTCRKCDLKPRTK